MHYFWGINSLIYYNNMPKTAFSCKSVNTLAPKSIKWGLNRPLNLHLTHTVRVCGPLTRFPRGFELHRAQRTHLPCGALWATRQMSTRCRINAHLLDVQPRRRSLISCLRIFGAPRRRRRRKCTVALQSLRSPLEREREKKAVVSGNFVLRCDTTSSLCVLSFHLRRFP